LNPGYQDNTVQLEIKTVQKETYRAELALLFGTKGDNGSDYTIDFEWSGGRNALDITSGANDSLTGNVIIRDKNGELV